jgi:hypothetical protein
MGQLKNRERVNIVMANDIMEWVRLESKNTDIPIARLVERAMRNYYKKEIEEYFKGKEN